MNQNRNLNFASNRLLLVVL